MTTKDLIRKTFAGSDMMIDSYLKGLNKEDLLIRAVPGMNHMAWQIGHLIVSERALVDMIRPGTMPPLPAGFAEAHSKENSKSDDAARFLAPEEYRKIWEGQRAASLALLDELPEEEFDRADPGFPAMGPTVGELMLLAAVHPSRHAGQFVAVRRTLNLPIAF